MKKKLNLYIYGDKILMMIRITHSINTKHPEIIIREDFRYYLLFSTS